MNLKKILKKRCLLMGLFFGVGYSVLMSISLFQSGNLTSALIFWAEIAIASGLMYGLIMYPVLLRQMKAMMTQFPELEQSIILSESNAFRLSTQKPKVISGWCLITANALYFSAELKKHRNFSQKIALHQITGMNMDLINRRECIKITTADSKEIFLQIGANTTKWAMILNDALKALPMEDQ